MSDSELHTNSIPRDNMRQASVNGHIPQWGEARHIRRGHEGKSRLLLPYRSEGLVESTSKFDNNTGNVRELFAV